MGGGVLTVDYGSCNNCSSCCFTAGFPYIKHSLSLSYSQRAQLKERRSPLGTVVGSESPLVEAEVVGDEEGGEEAEEDTVPSVSVG